MRQDDSLTWQDLVNDLRVNLEEKPKREQVLNSKYEEKEGQLEALLRKQKEVFKTLEARDLEIAQLKIKLRRAKPPNYGGGGEELKRPPSPMFSSSARKVRASSKRPQTPKREDISKFYLIL